VPSSDPIQRSSDIVENIERIERFTAGMNLQAFAAAEQTILVAKYALLTISEAATKLVHRFIQLMQLDVPSELSRRRPGSTFAVGTGFRRCSGFDMSDGASLPDESCE
jgi:hypothetical protein